MAVERRTPAATKRHGSLDQGHVGYNCRFNRSIPAARGRRAARPIQSTNAAEDRFHTFGPVGRHYVCFHHLTDLVAVDPRDGQTLWVRGDLPQDCIVFGDDRYVLVLAAHRDEALVLRASNGESIGVRKMPPIADERAAASCLATLGRKVLLWQTSKGAQVLSLFDPLEGRSDWPERKFAAGAQACIIEEKALAVMEPSGRFVLYSLPDGRTMAEMKLEAEPALRDITLFESGSRYFLVTSDTPPDLFIRAASRQQETSDCKRSAPLSRSTRSALRLRSAWQAAVAGAGENREPESRPESADGPSHSDLRLPSSGRGQLWSVQDVAVVHRQAQRADSVSG